jgi:hypothetical protein
MSLRERRLAQARKSLAAMREARERYFAMIVRYSERMQRCERKIRRLEKPAKPRPAPTPAETQPEAEPDIPTFLDRRKQGEQRDAEARAKIQAEQEERKRAKASARIEKMKRKRSGAAARMPLSGKAALAAIRGD